MLVISPNHSKLSGVFFYKYTGQTENVDKFLVENKTIFIQIDDPKKVHDVIRLSFGSISLAICTHDPEIAKILSP